MLLLIVEGKRERRSILVVDDDESLCDSVAAALEYAGYPTVCVSDGAAALDYLRNHPAPALVLLDLWMPGMDGWSFCEERRRDPDLAGIPVVVISSRGGPTRLAPYVGVEALLAKPVAIDDLLAAVEQFGARGVARRRRRTG